MSAPSMFGPYRLDDLLGRGGMGEVHRAFDTEHHRPVALKRLAGHLADDDEFLQRFRREAYSVAQLSNPHVVPIHRYGEIDGRLYIDMRLVEGGDLGDLIGSSAPLPPERAVALLEQIASALDDAHHHGLVHRDVKPTNVLLDAQVADFCYLADFGITRPVTTSIHDHTLTRSGAVLGSLAYMAPEQFAGKVTIQSDVYALTCVFFEMITGRRPYQGEGLPALMHAHLTVAPPRPSGVTPTAALFDGVVATGMAKETTARYARAGDLARAAREALQAHRLQATGAPHAVLPGTTTAGGPPEPPTDPGLAVAAAPPPRGRARTLARPWLGAVAAVAVILVIIASTWALARRDTSAQTPIAASTGATTTTAAAPTSAPAAGPANGPVIGEAVYTGRTSDGKTTLAIGFKNGKAAGYLCDGKSFEAWMQGTITGTQITLQGRTAANSVAANADQRSLQGYVVVRDVSYPFSAQIATGKAGLYQSDRRAVAGIGTRIGWIVLANGDVVGTRNQGGTISPAPRLDVTSLTAVDGTATVRADPVLGDTVVLAP